MQLLESARTLLESADFRTTAAGAGEDQFFFENANLYGLLGEFPLEQITKHWQEIQDAFIRQHTVILARVPEKAWNVYLVLLSSDSVSTALTRQLAMIEEDFRGARKIARGGIKSRDALESAVAPLLPLRFARPMPSVEVKDRISSDANITPRLRELLETGLHPQTIAAELLR